MDGYRNENLPAKNSLFIKTKQKKLFSVTRDWTHQLYCGDRLASL